MAATAQHQKQSTIPHNASTEKDLDSNFEVKYLLNVCCFHSIIKPKHHPSRSHPSVLLLSLGANHE
jgi:hypothetical protein